MPGFIRRSLRRDPIRILVASDEPILLAGLETVFSEREGYSVVDAVGCASGIVPAVERLAPDVLITGLTLNGGSALEAIRQISQRCSGTRVIVFSPHAELSRVRQAIRFGANGYVLNTIATRDLLAALRAVCRGRRYLSPGIDRQALERCLAKEGRPGDDAGTLTRREREVLELVAQGFTNKEIASRLGIGRRTVESHSGRLLCKLGVRNKAELVRHAIVANLVQV